MSYLDDKKIFLVGGPGGVGKTTLAASLGLRLAREGHRTVVLTVDPARRLAQALGFGDFKTELQPVAVPGHPNAQLFATMLDTQRYFDRVIGRFAKTPEQRDRILANPLYRIMVDHLGGTHEYAAMERLLEFSRDSAFDRIVVDTPPTQNAVDLLSAPQRLAEFMDSSVFKWFQGGSKPYLSLFRTGTKLAMKFLQKLFGSEFLDSLGKFFNDLEGMQAGFRQRHLEVLELMRSPSTAFLFVTYPSEARFLESQTFVKTLGDQRIPLAAIVLNRVEREVPRAIGAVPGLEASALAQVNNVLSYLNTAYTQQQTWVRRFVDLAATTPLVQVPRQEGVLHELSTLIKLGDALG